MAEELVTQLYALWFVSIWYLYPQLPPYPPTHQPPTLQLQWEKTVRHRSCTPQCNNLTVTLSMQAYSNRNANEICTRILAQNN